MQAGPLNHQKKLTDQIASQAPFSLLDATQQHLLLSNTSLVDFSPGQALLLPDHLQKSLFLVISGQVRLLANHPLEGHPITLSTCGSGQLLGWVSLLRASPCEWVTAQSSVKALAIPSEAFITCIRNSAQFASNFASLPSIHESFHVGLKFLQDQPKHYEGWFEGFMDCLGDMRPISIPKGGRFIEPKLESKAQACRWLLSTENVAELSVGSLINSGQQLPTNKNLPLPYRLVSIPVSFERSPGSDVADNKIFNPVDRSVLTAPTSLDQLGILEADDQNPTDDFPLVRGQGPLHEAMAVCEMISLHQSVPFRRDAIEKVLQSQFKRDKELSLELLAGLTELLGLKTQLGAVDKENFPAIESPALLFLEGVPVVVAGFRQGKTLVAHPHHGMKLLSSDEMASLGDRIRFAVPRRIGSTPTARFDWSWFIPLVNKYKTSLFLVFAASLLAQLVGLAIPLLIQQIIDKVLAQGNLSTLNVLGSAMIVLALLQGILTVLRTYVFVDTTDRMDLTLGSAVIDRLLGLPLTYFEKRPVGELSQRLGELNNIRQFLTGTALVSVLNIIFAVLYLIVMLIYSPFLTVVALSTLPIYILLVFVVAPIYKSLIRKRAVASARTQSHLIEVLSGIQTVKAQHFELTARWKWQDRYRDFVTEGFKSTALGATSSQIGAFLNTLSSLLVLWLGMGLVLKGELSLGMLIAFRIISGNVTGPLLQLSTLYQGFQGVQLSMERLGDILNQNAELTNSEGYDQISLPVIEGNIRFENVRFRFDPNGAYQIENVSLNVKAGSFVGIVGQSGSGKSTLMKLLPRLYDLESGRIFIDNYDIAKVDLSSLRRQIGIVPQESLLFEGTIAENISLNDPNASTESIIEAAKIACAHDFIMSLGQGYATPLSERGGNLSGGQRQRIAIARTILANPQLLVMDEATSALDYNTEKQLSANIQKWAENRTVFFITHRLSSIRESSQILVMNQGVLEESGRHDDLMSLKGRYCALYRQQVD